MASQPAGRPDALAALGVVVDQLAAEDLDGLADATRAERVLRLRRLLDRLEGHWLAALAGVDARGAAGADQGAQAPFDRRLAAQPPPPEPPRGHRRRADRPGPVPRPLPRTAPAVRDGGYRFPRRRPALGLVPGPQLVRRADARPTDLANLLSGAAQQHRAVHDGGWRLHRGPDGHLDARPPKRPRRRRPAAA